MARGQCPCPDPWAALRLVSVRGRTRLQWPDFPGPRTFRTIAGVRSLHRHAHSVHGRRNRGGQVPDDEGQWPQRCLRSCRLLARFGRRHGRLLLPQPGKDGGRRMGLGGILRRCQERGRAARHLAMEAAVARDDSVLCQGVGALHDLHDDQSMPPRRRDVRTP